ncbi:gp48 [Burkholderia lata]|uniref:Gp48 n=1 Tax=Burkholderia lata (strain ATCC 17760 / DSM 23089 / LMG 22485 / NCIMB 9086 / R18194 / 383) TaxID=482957 RepID=A0A6P2XHT7_BURL3|nr:glycosyl hydrolase family 28-related protein [Burkholderia lata]VWD09242.1 gp48 [Burkholderia lata]
MKRKIRAWFSAIAFALSLSFVTSTPVRAQFVPAPILTASQLANMFTSVSRFRSDAPGSISRTVIDKLQDVVNFRDFGGKCDGKTNDDAAMNAALSNLTAGELLVFPAGTCVFSTPKALPIVQNVSIRGAGARQTVLLYTGSNTTSDLWTVGDGTTSMTGWSISGLSFDSTTTMTAGAALHLKRMQNGSELFDVDAGVFGQPSRKLYNGVWLDNVNVFKYSKFNLQVRNQGLMMNGAPTSDEGSDIFLDDGVVTFSNIGYHVGGGQGGVYFGKILAYGNGTNFQVDNALAARRNREIFFSDQSVSDSSYGYGVWINDSLTSNAPVVLNGAFGSAGVLGGGSNGIEIYIQKWPNGRISLGPGQLYNSTSDGMRVDDASTIITIDSTRHIFNNGGYGVNATVPTTNIYSLSQYTASNRLGNYSRNVQRGALNVGGAISGTSITNSQQQVDKAYAYSRPSSGATVTIASGTQTALIDPAATLAALTITLPSCSSSYDGSIARFSSTQAITALTLGAASGTVAAPATALAAGAGHGYLCRGANTTWYPLY